MHDTPGGTTAEEGAVEQLPAHLLSAQSLHCVYQPFVDLETGSVLAHEALLRGPTGTRWASPTTLLAGARTAGRLTELELASLRISLAAAAGEARAHGSPVTLFVNVEPSTLTASPAVAAVLAEREPGVQVVVEITERALGADTAGILAGAEALRAAGCAIALDDVGVERDSLAYIPVLRPEIVKLDLRLLRTVHDPATITVAGAVRAYAEQSGAQVVAEGIETEDDRTRALVLGATIGQGWFWGRPDATQRPTRHDPDRFSPRLLHPDLHGTPFGQVTGQARRAPKDLLLPISRTIELTAEQMPVPPLLLACFQHGSNVTVATGRRYARLARRLPLVAALGTHMPPEPSPGVRGVDLTPDDPLADEWTVLALGPHDAVALIARDLGDATADRQRRFEFVVTHDRARVTRAAHTLLGRFTPR